MSAPHVEERLVLLVRGELEAGERHEVEAHLAGCAECRTVRDDFERLAAALARPAAPAVHWGAYRAELRDKLEGRAPRRPARGWAWCLRPMSMALAAGLVAVMIYVGGPGFGGRGGGNGEADIEDSILASRIDLLSRLDLVQRLDLLEDLDVIGHLDGREPRREG